MSAKKPKDEKLVELTGELNATKLADCVLQLLLRDFTPNEDVDTPESIQKVLAWSFAISDRYLAIDEGLSKKVINYTKPDMIRSNDQQVDEQRASYPYFANEIGKSAKLRNTLTKSSYPNEYYVMQIRSVPVRDFGYLLRHYFVRIDELVEIHPGNEQRVALRGWHSATDLATDRLECNYILCFDCFDKALQALWASTRKFNFSFHNCDHNCNESQQSIGIAVTIYTTVVAVGAILFEGVWVFFLLILCALFIFAILLRYVQTACSSLVASFTGNVQSYRCVHVEH